ncbi:hypothetical protein C5S42_11670 [Candidatus Methanomarinus sp.]|nr:hypothetical protein C5S42_11670 [ANME-2 cluster archaeon]
MIEINWNNFKAKFNGKERLSFEKLAYQLFCFEFNKKIGIFRFKNQTGIETEPIQTKTDCVGFQAKYSETKIADIKPDIIDSIKKAKNKNSKLTKILFYLNQEFSESTKKKNKEPQYKIDIENEANKNSVKIEWRVPSHFERQLSLPENNYLAEYFFNIGKNDIDFLNEIKDHTENILYSIQYEIKFNNQILKIDRTKFIETIEEDSEKSEIIIISGEGGSGKTALIKEFYGKVKDKTPFYIFKAAEFNISNIKEIFDKYGGHSLNEFIEIHKFEDKKFIVIDSAEKLSDLENQDAFIEFLSALLKSYWRIIFTTRYSYLDDLRFQFNELYRLSFKVIDIENLLTKELTALSEYYDFQLPSEKRLQSLIKNLFYLDEYLQNYQSFDNRINYDHFKSILWQKKIQKSTERKDNLHIERENCFLGLVKTRCESGLFYIKPEQWSNKVLSKLEADEIIKYDSIHGGYFITHDIYEEWALEKIIEKEFKTIDNYCDFFEQIGISLSIRRAFRNWLSEKIIDNIDDIKSFIENVFLEEKIKAFWKDELLISILLSNYSEAFFNQFEKTILEQNQSFLKRIVFILRIACKEVDNPLSEILAFQDNNNKNLKYVFTKPKGSGWKSTIDFVYKNMDKFSPTTIYYIIPLLQDWNNNNKTGETTRKATLFALHFYKEIQFNDDFRYSLKIEKELIKIILDGASEIKDELKAIFDEIIENKWVNHRDVYSDLCNTILTSTYNNIRVIISLPDYVIKLSDLFWFKAEKPSPYNSYNGMGVEKYYSLNSNWYHDYYPVSALQTPIYCLLQISFKETINFILDFTNKTVQSYVDSGFDKNIEEIEIIIDDKTKIKQFLSHSLWSMYRSTGSPAAPYLLQSIHMALEKWLMEVSKTKDEKIIGSWLVYLITNSISASITSVVTSVVLAYPDKFFNVAKILFQKRELFFCDNIRAAYEHQAKNLYSMGYDLNYKNKIFEDERIKTCDDSHRKISLENLALNYQFIRSENLSEEVFEHRQKVIWDIIDGYYAELPDKSKETDNDKTLKLLLARIDKRKMNPTIEQKDNKILINFNPEIEPELKKHSEDAVKKDLEMMKYTALILWSTHKFDNNKKNGDNDQYENNPQLVLKETKEIVNGLKNSKNDQFHLFNSSIPAFTCSALIREYEKELTTEEKEYCKNIIVEYATEPFRPNYQYQTSDGVEVAVNALPFLFNLFPDEKKDFKIILLFILFDSYPQYKRIYDYSIEAIINNLWDISYEDAHAIFLGFLKLKPKYNQLENDIVKEKHRNFNHRTLRNQVLENFVEEFKSELENIASNNVLYDEIRLNELNLDILETAFQLLPLNTSNAIHIDFINNTLTRFSKELLADNDKTDYSIRDRFFENFSYFILNRETENINKFIQPFIDDFSNTKKMAYFFQKIISTEDKLNNYEQFWLIWWSFYDSIVVMCKNRASNFYLSEIVHNYLLAGPYWGETAKEWHSLKDREKEFYKKISKDIGHCPSVLYSISKLLNGIGSGFLSDGIFWISEMIEKNSSLSTEELETNTIYYIEVIIREYIYLNRTKIKTDLKIKNKILIILNFLIEKGSVNSYLLREDLL